MLDGVNPELVGDVFQGLQGFLVGFVIAHVSAVCDEMNARAITQKK